MAGTERMKATRRKARKISTRRSNGTESITEPLLIPPKLLIDQDVSFGPTKLRRALQNLGHYVIYVGDKQLADKEDTTIAQEAIKVDAAVVTSDKSFLKTVITQGSNSPNYTIVVPKMKKQPNISDTLTKLAEVIDEIVRSPTLPGYKALIIIDQDQDDFEAYKLEIPAEILQLVPFLEARGDVGLSISELASYWEQPKSIARRKAEKLVKEGWLYKERRGRKVFYVKSALLEQLLDRRGGTGVRGGGQVFTFDFWRDTIRLTVE